MNMILYSIFLWLASFLSLCGKFVLLQSGTITTNLASLQHSNWHLFATKLWVEVSILPKSPRTCTWPQLQTQAHVLAEAEAQVAHKGQTYYWVDLNCGGGSDISPLSPTRKASTDIFVQHFNCGLFYLSSLESMWAGVCAPQSNENLWAEA